MTSSEFFKCLSDDTRLHLTLLVGLEGEVCVCEFVQALDESQPKISRHLAQLRNCGILTDRRQGQWVFYALNPDLPSWARHVLEITTVTEGEVLDQYRMRLGDMDTRPVCR